MTDTTSAKVVLWLALGAAISTTLFFFTSSLDPFNLPKSVLILGGGLAILFSLLPLLKRVEKERWVSASPLLLFGGTYILAALSGTDNSRRLLFGAFSRATGLISYVGMILLALGLLLATRGQKFTALYIALAAVAGFEVLYGFLQFLNVDPVKWSNPYNRIIGSLGNPNFMSATLGFSGVAMVSLLFDPRLKRIIRITSPILGVCAFLLALASQSVQGPIAFAGGVAFVFGVFLWQWKPKSIYFYGYASVSGAILIVVLLGVAKIGPLADKLYQYTLGVRTQYWRAALKMMGDSPLVGVGVDSFGEHYRLVRDATTFKTVGPGTFTNAAHSVPLQLGATLGVPVLVMYIVLQVFVAYRIYVSMKAFPEYRISIAGIAGAWLAFQAQSVISIDQLGVGVWGWILTGSLIGGSYAVKSIDNTRRVRKRDLPQSNAGFVGALGVFGLVLGLAVGWQGYLPDLHIRGAMALPWDQNSQQSIDQRVNALLNSAKEISQDTTYQALVITELAKMPGVVEPTVNLAIKVARDHPESWDAQNMAAEILENVKRQKEAVLFRRAQLGLDPANWYPYLTLASDFEGLGDKSEAIAAYRRVIDLAPKSAEATTAQAALTRLG